MKIGILGGTFDPPHLGHLGMALNVLKTGKVREIWFVPCLAHRFGKAPTAFEHRVAMCRILIAGHAPLSVSTIEKSINRPGYTLDLVIRLIADFPTHRFYLIAGQDIYHQKENWHHYNEIALLAPPIYVARVGEPPIPEPLVEAPIDVSSSEIRQLLAEKQPLEDRIPAEIVEYINTHKLYTKDK